ncbi:efflux RND transporter periplasmic adaptor subunit [Pseudoalteromonas luteoviolacea]|uniref:efflux RND transporter periplasmic adaptor subunit n=1 Tax=Pseudoalteromonas luteoviolacea TaxID=43657 RepID=UPI001B37C85B|nr:efflux RND transporter periplasmic adaptor subunit [Pseudoalteromonas luteoviolacea]MBQ4811874.1 efflux RND transporter periplasmic adaptor subunit [Pseudoalteromonas luteoviolacea]
MRPISLSVRHSKVPQFIFVLGLFYSTYSIATPQAPLVKTTSVSLWQNGIQGQLSCQVSVPYTYTIASESEAKLNYLVSAGSYVKAGDLLAEQDGFYLQQSLKAMQYELIQHKANFTFHNQEYQRLVGLDEKHVSASAVNEHALSLELAKHAVEATNSRIKTLEKQLSALKHYAPHSGEITELHNNIGSFVPRGGAILSFTATDDKELHCEVPIKQSQRNSRFQDKMFFLSKSEPLELKRYAHSVNQRHQTQSVWFHVPPNLLTLPTGKLINIHWQSKTPDLVKLPTQAVIFEQDTAYVWRVNSQQVIEKVLVEVMQNQAHHFIVRGTLHAGEQVIVMGQSNLTEGIQVRLTSPPTLLAQGE